MNPNFLKGLGFSLLGGLSFGLASMFIIFGLAEYYSSIPFSYSGIYFFPAFASFGVPLGGYLYYKDNFKDESKATKQLFLILITVPSFLIIYLNFEMLLVFFQKMIPELLEKGHP